MRRYDVVMAPIEFFYLKKIRKNLMKHAKGKVLEIGFGNGANVKYYHQDQINEFHALDVSDTMRKFDHVIYHKLSAETLPFEDETFDTIVITLALCSIPDQIRAIREIKRVLKNDGQYLFIEHELPRSKGFKGLFKAINPYWKKMSGGCQIILKTHKKLLKEGFKLNYNRKHIFTYGIATKA